jgi:hypothetical protein
VLVNKSNRCLPADSQNKSEIVL